MNKKGISWPRARKIHRFQMTERKARKHKSSQLCFNGLRGLVEKFVRV